MKDAWDKFHSISTFSSGVLIALIGLYFTHSYNEHQSEREANIQAQNAKIMEMETAEKYIAYLAKGSENERRAAILMIKTLASDELAIAVVEAFPSEGAREAGNIIMMTAAPAEKQTPPVKTTTSITEEHISKEGWLYLGDYSDTTGEWVTRYLDFDLRAKPQSLNGRVLTVSTDLNVRKDMKYPDGTFARVIDILEAGSQVEIREVRQWSTTGYMWARVSYSLAAERTAEHK